MTDRVPAPPSSLGAAWPSTPQAFADTSLCPRCFSVLPSSRCRSCGLELAVPRAAELIAASNDLVGAARRRAELIESMWNEQQAAQVRASTHVDSVPGTPQARPQQAPPIVPDAAVAAAASVTPPPFPAAEPSPVTSGPAAGAPRRSGVQVFLLVAGIVLVSVFALFFLTVAYLFATVEVRVIVTALAGLVVFGVAGVLARRRLPATAEGVGVAGAAILLGTLGFVRAAELFGSASIAPAAFSGFALLAVAALLTAMHRVTALRFARIGGLVLTPVGVALLVIGALDPVDTGLAWCAGLVAAAAAALCLRVGVERAAEAALLRSIAAASVTAALLPAALLLPEVSGSSALAYSTLALVCVGFLERLRRESGPRAWSCAASMLLGLSVSLAPTVAILRAATPESNLWAPGAAAAVVASALVVVARRPSGSTIKSIMSWAQFPALVVAAIGLLPGVGFGLVHVLGSLIPRYALWQAEPGDTLDIVPGTGAWAAVLAPGIAAILGAVAIRLVRLPGAAHSVVGGLAGLALLATASHAGSVQSVLLAYLLVAVFSLSILLAIRGRHASAIQTPAGVVLAVAGSALVVVSHADSQLWSGGVLAAAGLVIAARFAIAVHAPARSVVRALLTAVAATLLFAEATLVIPWLSGWRTGASFAGVPFPNAIDVAALPAAAAALILCVTPIALPRRTDRFARGAADLRAVAIVALPVATIGAATVFASAASTPGDHVARIAIPLILAIAGVLWQVPASVVHLVERVVLAALAPLSIAAALAAASDAIPASPRVVHDLISGPAPAILSALVGVLAFGRAGSRLRGAAPIAWESATALIVIVAAAGAMTNADDSTWLILLLLAVAPLIVAFSLGNPFTGTASRRHLFALSCILAVASLWQFLSIRGMSDVEFYTLPVGGLLLCIAVAAALFGHRSASAVAGRSGLFATGLATALVPSAIAATTESSVRAIVVLLVAIILTGAALVASRVVRGVLLRDSTIVLALVVLLGVGLSRTVGDAIENAVLVPELWTIPAALALAATSVVWTRRQAEPFRIAQLGIPAAIAFTGLSTVVCLLALPETDAPGRLVISGVLLAAIAVAASVHSRVPLDRVSQVTALSVLAVIAATGVLTNAADPIELATAPLAFGLIGCGVVALLRDRAARSWPNLGPGIVVLLAPALLADFGGTELWRVITLGVLAVVIVVGAAVFRLQAPLVVGGVVLIAHALAQSWPWIQGLYSAVPWWIWLGVGGVVLIAVAARYEHRVRNLKSFVGSITALR
jgi:hypothetical protein